MTKQSSPNPFEVSRSWWLLYVALIVMTLAISLYCLGDQSWNIKKHYFFGDVFWDMWLKLSHGDLTADRHIIYEEAMVIDGKTYAYFLPFPALIRGILSLFQLGQYAIPSVLLAITIFLFSSLKLYLQLIQSISLQTKEAQWLAKFIGGLLVIGSPILMMLSYPMMFWEAIIWGATLFLLCSQLANSLLSSRYSTAKLLLFSATCGLAIFTRPTIVVATIVIYILTIFSLFQQQKIDTNHLPPNKSTLFSLAASLVLFGVFLLGLGEYNYLKWGSPFEFGNLKNYTLIWTPEYYKIFLQSGLFQPDRFLEGFAFYFLPNATNFINHFPFIQFGGDNLFLGFAKQIHYREAPLSFFITMPLYELGFFIGVVLYVKTFFSKEVRRNSLWRNCWPIALSSLVPMFILLGWFAQSVRYSGDFIPGLLFYSIASLILLVKIIDSAIVKTTFKFDKLKFVIGCSSLAMLTLYLTLTANYIQRQAPLLKALAYFIPPPPTTLNQTITFGNTGTGRKYLQGAITNANLDNGGWSVPESWGVWSNGKSAILEFPTPVFPIPADKELSLLINFRAFINPPLTKQKISIFVNGDFYKDELIQKAEGNEVRITLPAPKKDDPKTQMRYVIEFKLPDAISPLSVGAGDDQRILSIGLESAVFQ